ncbi:MAG: non-canonical purine NTP pyrophosphatase [Pirellulaceae bacterium]|nr:MAG: non-canonical purine NTP pyrophosphatase [Pirellulaceae bacterium]
MIERIVVGSRNEKKKDELLRLVQPLGIKVLSLDDCPNALVVIEDGTTFAENAAKKASQQARHLGEWVLADDSGLCVDALGGAPGVLSAYYAGPNATDEQNNERLLEALRDVPDEKRTAHYVCHLALADPSGAVRLSCEETCSGRITRQPRGSHGFGYDPLFEIPEYRRTFGELGEPAKSVLSHRGRAMRTLLRQLRHLLAEEGHGEQKK